MSSSIQLGEPYHEKQTLLHVGLNFTNSHLEMFFDFGGNSKSRVDELIKSWKTQKISGENNIGTWITLCEKKHIESVMRFS